MNLLLKNNPIWVNAPQAMRAAFEEVCQKYQYNAVDTLNAYQWFVHGFTKGMERSIILLQDHRP